LGDIRKIDVMEECGNKFEDNIKWCVGDEKSIRVWKDRWVGNDPLKEKYLRFYLISDCKETMLCDIKSWQDNNWKWSLEWRRTIFE